ncbi:MAG TPA: hypothetical protein VD927_18660 [Chryseosolibacter sp.]|nr:hypothetical protein [Chryseosolibacter sp.]
MRKTVITLFLVLGACSLWAQPNIPPDPPSAAVPFEGLGFLLAAGGLLGFNKIKKHFKK